MEHLLPGVDVAAAGDEEQEDLLLVVKEDGAEVPDLSSEEEREAHQKSLELSVRTPVPEITGRLAKVRRWLCLPYTLVGL